MKTTKRPDEIWIKVRKSAALGRRIAYLRERNVNMQQLMAALLTKTADDLGYRYSKLNEVIYKRSKKCL